MLTESHIKLHSLSTNSGKVTIFPYAGVLNKSGIIRCSSLQRMTIFLSSFPIFKTGEILTFCLDIGSEETPSQETPSQESPSKGYLTTVLSCVTGGAPLVGGLSKTKSIIWEVGLSGLLNWIKLQLTNLHLNTSENLAVIFGKQGSQYV